MTTTNFLQFDTQQTNMLSDSEYQTDRERLSGFTTGISRSILFNKAVFQASTMATALATVITNRGFDALDNNLNSLVQAINTAFPESRGLPVGSLLPVTQLVTRVPDGFLLPDGEPFDPAEYPELADAYRLAANTYAHGQVQRDGIWWPKTPNLRGYFIRVHQNRSFESGFPDGGRQWGSTQTDSTRSHTHNLKVHQGLSNVESAVNTFPAAANYAASASRAIWNTTTNANNQVVIASTGGTETRPYNVALTHLIVAKTGVNLGSLQGGVEWGQIGGDITSQADLQEALSKKLENQATGNLSIAIGYDSEADERQSVSMGDQTRADVRGTSVGSIARSGWLGTAIGADATASGDNSVALGVGADALGAGSIQIGNGVNNEDESMYVYLGTQKDITGDGVAEWVGNNYKLLGSDGKFPAARLPDGLLEDIAVAGDNIKFKPETEPNVTIVGSPTIENNVASFSANNYITTSNPITAEECTRIEMVLVFEVPELVTGPMFATANPDTAPYFRVNTSASGLLTISYTDANGEQKVASAITSFITANTKIWYKALWTSTTGLWGHYTSSDEGVTWTQIKVNTGYANPPSLLSGDTLYWGSYGSSSETYFNGKIYLDDSYISTISVSGVRNILKLVKETGKTEVSAIVPEADLTGYLQNTATGQDSIAIHPKDAPWTYASGTMSIAIGAGSSDSSVKASGQFALAMCSYAQATGDYAISIGGSSSATKAQNVSVGYNADAIYDYSTAIGGSAQATGMGATCLGRGATAGAANTVAIGYNSKAQQTGTTAIGMGAQALYTGGTAIGVGADVLSGGSQATAIGYQAQAGGAQAIQLGYGTNSDAKTFKVGFYDASAPTNYTLLASDGTIPGERMSLQGTTAPDTTTIGSVGQFYVDTATGTGYMCVGADTATPAYTWKQITV